MKVWSSWLESSQFQLPVRLSLSFSLWPWEEHSCSTVMERSQCYGSLCWCLHSSTMPEIWINMCSFGRPCQRVLFFLSASCSVDAWSLLSFSTLSRVKQQTVSWVSLARVSFEVGTLSKTGFLPEMQVFPGSNRHAPLWPLSKAQCFAVLMTLMTPSLPPSTFPKTVSRGRCTFSQDFQRSISVATSKNPMICNIHGSHEPQGIPLRIFWRRGFLPKDAFCQVFQRCVSVVTPLQY